MRKVLALLAGLTMVTGMAFAADTTTGAVHIEREKATTKGAVHIEIDRTTDGAVHIEKDKTTTKGAVHVEIDKTTDGAVHVEKVRTSTDGSIISTKEFDRTTDGAIKGPKQEGKAFGQQREKNPVAEGNKTKVEALTDEQKAALKAQAQEMKASREKETGNADKKGKFGKNK